MNEIKIDHMDIVVCTWSQKAWEEQASQQESKNPQNPMDDVVLGGTLSGCQVITSTGTPATHNSVSTILEATHDHNASVQNRRKFWQPKTVCGNFTLLPT